MKYGTPEWYATWVPLVYGLEFAEATETWRLVDGPVFSAVVDFSGPQWVGHLGRTTAP